MELAETQTGSQQRVPIADETERRPMYWTLKKWTVLAFALVVGTAIAFQSSGTVFAQNAEASYPVSVHDGSCEAPEAEPLHDVDDAVLRESMDDAEMVGQADTPVYEGSTTLDMSIGDLTESERSVIVHASEDQFSVYVACGTIAGAEVDGRMIVPIRPLQSQVLGIAVVDADEGDFLGLGDDEVNLTVYLFSEGLIEATPAAEEPTPLPDQPEAATPTTEPTATPSPTEEPTQTPTEEPIELPTEATLELLEDGSLAPTELTIPAETDFELTLTNLTDSDAEFSVAGTDVSESVPGGDVVTTTINLGEGDHEFSFGDQSGTITAMPTVEQ